MIKIAHLYYDLMNLYGDNGNIKMLKNCFEAQAIKTSIEFLTIDDDINFDDYDIFYIGPGTWNNEKMVLKNLLKYKNEIKKAIDDNKFFLITGNALELFGEYILDNSKKIEALNCFSFYSEKGSRIVGEVYAKTNEFDDFVLGFKNQDSVIKTNIEGFFKIVEGPGFDETIKEDGIFINNFLGTYMIGPILVRNPELLKFYVKRVIDSKFTNAEFKDFDLELEEKAHQEYLNNYFKQNS